MNIAAILLCAGTGSRFKDSLPKQFHPLGEKMVYEHALETLITSNLFSAIYIPYPKGYKSLFKEHPKCISLEGGKTRQESVYLALQRVANADGVVICDGARPFLTKEQLEDHVAHLRDGKKAVNTYTLPTDTISTVNKGVVSDIPSREQFLLGQTPQSFSYKELLRAHDSATKGYTDDCAIMLQAGYEITTVWGDRRNIKITSPFDLTVAKAVYKEFSLINK